MKALFRLIVGAVIIFCLFLLNAFFGVRMNLSWLYYPELTVVNIFGNYTMSYKMQCDISLPDERFDCHPEKSASKAKCEQRGCCWNDNVPQMMHKHEAGKKTTINVPACFYPRNFPGYNVQSVQQTKTGSRINISGVAPSYYPGGVSDLIVDVMLETDQRLHVKISDPNKARYEVPLDVPKCTKRADNPSYHVAVSDVGSPFWLNVTRSIDNITVFSTKGVAPLIFTDQFLQLSSMLPSMYMYGLGEHRQSLMLDANWTQRTMWNVDSPPKEDTNLYGSHPFYLVMEETGKASGFFLLNSNAMDVILQPYPAVTWRTIGGILDFYVFVGQEPSDIVREYTNVVGRTFMPPYWSLGFHICRFGYKTVNNTMKVVDRVRKAGIPQDVQWNDIDYAVGKRDFTSDTVRFGDQRAMVAELHRRGMSYVVIVDPGISNSQLPGSYKPYDLGMEMDIFIKNDSNQPFVGKVWPGTTVFPDFSNPKSDKYWTTLIVEFWRKISVDGLWIDMNEIANFINGSITGCPSSSSNEPPYLPDVLGGKLYSRTICPSARQYLSLHYNLHNMYGLMEARSTYLALKSLPVHRRPFVISRSTYAGQGRYSGHWTGDNFATYHDMYRSISAILTMNLAGIPMVGADICGFNDDTNYELCLRWYQLGAFYPFSRSHNSDQSKKDQDPGAFDDFFAASVRNVYLTRYSILPYLYTLFYESHMTGTPVARAMFYEFPSNKKTYQLDKQFMWGSSLLIVPVLTEKATQVDVFLPADSIWYNFYSGEQYVGEDKNLSLPAPLNVINLLMRSGTIIPMQEPALTTSASRLKDFSLLVSLDVKGFANGSLFWDDGSSQDSIDVGKYGLINFSAQEKKLKSDVLRAGYVNKMLKNVTVYGIDQAPGIVKMNSVVQTFHYDPILKFMRIPLFKPPVSLMQNFVLEWN